jgi:hypothetical protein
VRYISFDLQRGKSPFICLSLNDATLDRAKLYTLGLIVLAHAFRAGIRIDFSDAFSGFNRSGWTIRFAIATGSTQIWINFHCHDDSPFEFFEG